MDQSPSREPTVTEQVITFIPLYASHKLTIVLVTIPIQINPVHNIPSLSFKIKFNIFLKSLSFGISKQKFVGTSALYAASHRVRSALPSLITGKIPCVWTARSTAKSGLDRGPVDVVFVVDQVT